MVITTLLDEMAMSLAGLIIPRYQKAARTPPPRQHQDLMIRFEALCLEFEEHMSACKTTSNFVPHPQTTRSYDADWYIFLESVPT